MSHHATLSPSSFPALDQCPCFKSAPGTSDAAEEGTKQHRDLENILNNVATCGEIAPGVWWAKERISSQLENYESEVELHLLKDFKEITFGTADAIGFHPDGMLVVYDYKSGMQRDSSAQLAVYALMAMQKYGKTECVCIVGYGRDQWEDWWEMSLEEAERIVYGIIDRVQNNPQPSICEYCQWCERSGSCEAEVTAITTVSAGYDGAVDLTDIETWHTSEITNPDQMAKVYKVACILSKWADSAKHHAKDAVQKGMVLPGFKLRNGAKKRYVSNILEAYELSGLNPQEFLACCSVKVAQLEKAVGEKQEIKGKALKTQMTEQFEEVIYIKENAPSLVAEKEKK